uniref:Uncharacterized protein n=1 Tax=viral metagenome TaxID=1070528 RepID=A0A6C0BCX3_9ZZZZ
MDGNTIAMDNNIKTNTKTVNNDINIVEIDDTLMTEYEYVFIEKLNELRIFCETHADKPKQGTKKWKEERNNTNKEVTVGGSEMSTVLGENKYNNIDKLIQTKLGLLTFSGNDATRWGNFFEPVGQLLIEKLFDCVLYETGSLPGSIPNTSYSPDGFSVIYAEKIQKLIIEKNIEQHTLPFDKAGTILFEIKSPYSRIPTNYIPDEYKAQPQSGLAYFKFIDIAYFINIVFRACTLKQFTGLGFVNTTTQQKIMITEDLAVSYKGIIGIYSESRDSTISYDENIIDLVESGEFSKIIYFVSIGRFGVVYFDIDEDLELSISKYKKICIDNSFNMVGIIPYKILKTVIIPVYRDIGFIDAIKEPIRKFVNLYNEEKIKIR